MPESSGKLLDRIEFLQILTVLRLRDFRVFWLGMVVQVLGQSMMFFTLGWLAYDLTGSPLSLGYISLFQALPTIAFTMAGGVAADRWDQRRLIFVTQILGAVTLAGVGVLSVTGNVELWHLMVVALFMGAIQSLESPSRVSLFPLLLPDRSHMRNAVAIFSLVWQLNSVLAPAVAGFVIAYSGAGQSFLLSAIFFSVMAVVVRSIRLVQESPSAGKPADNPAKALAEGARYCWSDHTMRVLLGLSFFTGIFAFSYMSLLPIFAKDILLVDARGLGFLGSAAGVGSVFGVVITPWLSRRFHVGRLIILEIVLMSLLLLGFSFSRWYYLSLGIMPFLGMVAFSNVTLLATAMQMIVPDALRGRVMGMSSLRWTLMPLGGALLGVIANFLGAPIALSLSAGLVIIVTIATMILNTHIRGLRYLESRG